jgi:hypothetical protein
MTPQQLIGLAVRFFSVWLTITSIAYFSSIPQALKNAPLETGASVAVAYGLGVTYLVGALVLWFCPMLLAHKLLPRTQYENRLSFQVHELARVGCALVGLWLLSQSLPSLVWVIFRSILFVDSGSAFSALTPEARLDVFVALFQAGFALLVLFKSKAFANIVVPEIKAESNGL